MRLLVAIRRLDWTITSCALLLVAIGLAMFISATYTQGFISPLFIRQAVAAGVGFALFLLVAKIPYHVWRRWTPVVYGAGLALLILVTVIGETIRGTISRLEIGGIQIQPSEYMKIGFVLLLAWLLARYQNLRWTQVLMSAAVVGIPVAFVLLEPDFGMAALLIATWAGLLITLGLRWRYIIIIALIGLISAGAAWQWMLYDYQKERIYTFLNPEADPLQSGYNITQSLIAFGSGKVLGRGLGHGPQSQLKFLPERHTDFILASVGEELGFIGVITILILYAAILWRILHIARNTRDRFGQILNFSIFLMLLASLTVSAGMNMGILPVTGIPLPLVSYGGSSLVTTFILLGLVQSVHINSHFLRQPAPELSHFV